jgi:hypothetical protein
MSTRHPFQFNVPTFVKIPFTGKNRRFARGDSFDWKGLGIPEDRVLHMFAQGYLFQKAVEPVKSSLDVFREEMREIQMSDLQKLARAEGAATTNTKERQIELIFEHRQRVAAEDAILMKRDRMSESELEADLNARRGDTPEDDQ